MSLWIDKQFLTEYIFNWTVGIHQVASKNYSEFIISGNYLIVLK